MDKKLLNNVIFDLVNKSAFNLRADVLDLLNKSYTVEEAVSKKAVGWIKESCDKSCHQSIALCQDTGLPVLFVTLGKKACISAEDLKYMEICVADAYAKNYLRESAVDPIERGSSGYDGVIIHVDYDMSFEGIKLTVFSKGFGSENKSQLKMFNPTAKKEEIEEFVIDSVRKAGPDACPPYVVGVGIGGTADESLLLAKKALLDDIRNRSSDKTLAEMEQNIFKKVNELNIGPMGFGGKTTALAVKIKKEKTHIAGLPVGVNISCWALRSASAVLGNGG